MRRFGLQHVYLVRGGFGARGDAELRREARLGLVLPEVEAPLAPERGARRQRAALRGELFGRGELLGPPRAPLRDLNKDEKRSLEQVIRVMDRTVDELTAGAGKGGK